MKFYLRNSVFFQISTQGLETILRRVVASVLLLLLYCAVQWDWLMKMSRHYDNILTKKCRRNFCNVEMMLLF